MKLLKFFNSKKFIYNFPLVIVDSVIFIGMIFGKLTQSNIDSLNLLFNLKDIYKDIYTMMFKKGI